MRKFARLVTQHYDAHLAGAGLTIGQFGFLAKLERMRLQRQTLSLKGMAASIGMDPTTLHRNLKPLEREGWIRSEADPADRRARLLSITLDGQGKLAAALPLWRAAQAAVVERLGEETVLSLNALLQMSGGLLAER